jgi:hypothetical protein
MYRRPVLGAERGCPKWLALLLLATAVFCWNFSVVAVAQGQIEPSVGDIHEAKSAAVGIVEDVAVIDVPIQKQCCFARNGLLECRNCSGIEFFDSVFVFVPSQVRLAYEAASRVIGKLKISGEAVLSCDGPPISDAGNWVGWSLPVVFDPASDRISNVSQCIWNESGVAAVWAEDTEVCNNHVSAELPFGRVFCVFHQVMSFVREPSRGSEQQERHDHQWIIPPPKILGFIFVGSGLICCPICLYFLFGPRTRPHVGVPLFLLGLFLIGISIFFLTSRDERFGTQTSSSLTVSAPIAISDASLCFAG